jgi:hypothetical protein
MNAQSPKKPASAELRMIKTPAPWQRLRLQATRLAGQIGFKPMAGVLIVVLLAALWLDDATDKLATERRANASISTEVAKMQALTALKTKIEQGLKDSIPLYDQARQRGLNAPTLDAAIDSWKAELFAGLQGLRIEDPVFDVPQLPAKSRASDLAVLDVDFNAVPDQVLGVVDQIEKSDRLVRIAALDLTAEPDATNPHLHVHARLEAHYFAPESKSKSARPAGGNSRPSGAADKKAKP